MDEECWEYLDPKSVKRGPFSSTRMALWYGHQMLPDDLGVRHSASMAFVPIRELFHPPLLPFRSRPRPCAVQPSPSSAKCQCHWQYCDTRGQLQGPFTSPQMAQWYEHGMLPKSLQLRRTTDTAFATMSDYFPKPLIPFQSFPASPSLPSSREVGAAPTTVALAATGPPPSGKALPKQQLVAKPPPVAKPANAPQQPSAQTPAQPLPAQPAPSKAKAAPKGKVAPKMDGNQQGGYPDLTEVESGKGAGRGAGPIGGGEKGGRGQRGKQSALCKDQGPGAWGWPEQGWSQTDKAWWEWSSWNSWAPEVAAGSAGNSWEHNGREKQHGADWKTACGEGAVGGPIGASPPKEKGEKGATAVQAAFGSLRWGPHAEDEDLFPEATMRRVLDEGIVWEERWISPLAVRFSQGKIHPFFHERGPISEVVLQIRLKEDTGNAAIKRIDPPFPPIRLLHLKEQGVLITLDNRRLYALQRFALQEWPTVCLAKALCVDELTPTRLRAENRKFTNRVCGLQLEVESRSNAFDTFSWVTEAAHTESSRFCRPVAFRAADKAISLLPVLIVHGLLCQRLRRFLRSRWPLLRFLALTLHNPHKREFPSKRLLLHHVFELAKPSQKIRECPSVCVGYKAETVVTLRNGKSCVKSVLSVVRPVSLLQAPQPLSEVQWQVLSALVPFFCLPYARSALRGHTRDWVVAFLLAWGKIAAVALSLPRGP